MDNRLPAEVETLDLPEFLDWILRMCWKQDPEARPSMPLCLEVITSRDHFKVVGEGCYSMYYSGSCKYDFSTSFDAHPARCVAFLSCQTDSDFRGLKRI